MPQVFLPLEVYVAKASEKKKAAKPKKSRQKQLRNRIELPRHRKYLPKSQHQWKLLRKSNVFSPHLQIFEVKEVIFVRWNRRTTDYSKGKLFLIEFQEMWKRNENWISLEIQTSNAFCIFSLCLCSKNSPSCCEWYSIVSFVLQHCPFNGFGTECCW